MQSKQTRARRRPRQVSVLLTPDIAARIQASRAGKSGSLFPKDFELSELRPRSRAPQPPSPCGCGPHPAPCEPPHSRFRRSWSLPSSPPPRHDVSRCPKIGLFLAGGKRARRLCTQKSAGFGGVWPPYLCGLPQQRRYIDAHHSKSLQRLCCSSRRQASRGSAPRLPACHCRHLVARLLFADTRLPPRKAARARAGQRPSWRPAALPLSWHLPTFPRPPLGRPLFCCLCRPVAHHAPHQARCLSPPIPQGGKR